MESSQASWPRACAEDPFRSGPQGQHRIDQQQRRIRRFMVCKAIPRQNSRNGPCRALLQARMARGARPKPEVFDIQISGIQCRHRGGPNESLGALPSSRDLRRETALALGGDSGTEPATMYAYSKAQAN